MSAEHLSQCERQGPSQTSAALLCAWLEMDLQGVELMVMPPPLWGDRAPQETGQDRALCAEWGAAGATVWRARE